MVGRVPRFSGRTVMVTGGSGGLGRAVCAGLAAEGAVLAIVDIDAQSVAEAVGALRDGGARVEGHVLDVTDRDAVEELMARVAADLGGPHVLVNLAGGSLGTPRDLADIEPEHVDRVLDVNVKGTLYCCQAAVPRMVAAGGGAIVNTSSIGARQPSPVTGVPYAAAKAAVIGLTKRLAREVGPHGVRVNAIAPGLFLTGRLLGMFDRLSDGERAEVIDAIPLHRMPKLREAVDPVLFLASDEASYVTGVVLDVNGGRFMPL